MNKMLFLIWWLIFSSLCCAQQDSVRMAEIRLRLDSLVAIDPDFGREADISVGDIPLNEMLRTVARVNGVNIVVKADNRMISCNFNRAKIIDLLYFICDEYDMTIDIFGNIVSVRPFELPALPPLEPVVEYFPLDTTLSYDLLNHTLPEVVKEISDQSKVNIIVPQALYSKQISGFVTKMPLSEAIEILAESNNLTVENPKKGVWNFIQPRANDQNRSLPAQQYIRHRQFSANQFSVDSLGFVTANIVKGNVYDLILDLCEQMKWNYFFITPVHQQTSVFVRHVEPETLLNVMLAGTSYSYYIENGVYMFGNSSKEKPLISVRLLQLKYRTVEKVTELIPQALKTGVQVQAFPDLNALIVSGDQRSIAGIENFIREIDKNVPMVTIEIMIVDVSQSVIKEVGLTAGIGGEKVVRNGMLAPGINMNLGAATINRLINSLNGWGSINLGKVPADFYANLKLLEENGNIELRSTPKLSTLNGHEATLKSGETKYYKEVQNNIIGTQNPIQSESFIWKSVEANLSLKITPFISEDQTITLDVEIEQTEFTAREDKDAPPGTATRKFKSIVRVKNEDMVLLGGIERNSREKSSQGLPFIARVPVLKWIFGTTKDNKSVQKLNVFIKSTVI